MLNVKKVNYDEYFESGCETCDYGSSYVNKIQIILEDGTESKLNIDKMYDYVLSESDIMKLIANSNNLEDFYIKIINFIQKKKWTGIKLYIKLEDLIITINKKQVDILKSLEKQKIVFKENV